MILFPPANPSIRKSFYFKNRSCFRDRFLQIMTVLDNLYISAYNHSISVQKGDDHYDKRNFDAHNVIQRKDRPEVIPLFSVSEPLYIACRGTFYIQTAKRKEQKA